MAAPGRAGKSLLELLVVIAIAGVLVTLTLAGVMRLRDGAARTACRNNLRQNMLAAHAYAAAHDNKLPTVIGRYEVQFRAARLTYFEPLFVAMLPFLEQGGMYSAYKSADFMSQNGKLGRVPSYRCPGDPSDDTPAQPTLTSYGANAYVFTESPKLVAGTFPDGVSNTIAFVEHYATCGAATFEYQLVSTVFPYQGHYDGPGTTTYNHTPDRWAGRHRPTANDGGKFFDNQMHSYDYYPKTQPGSDTLAGWAFPVFPPFVGVTFQAQPAPKDCLANLANTPHPVMTVAMADGSVRGVKPGIADRVYWALMTRNGGEVVGEW